MKYKLTKNGSPRSKSYIGTINIKYGAPATHEDIEDVCCIQEECARRNKELRELRKCQVGQKWMYRWRWRLCGRKPNKVIRNRPIRYTTPLEKATEADIYMYEVIDYPRK